MKVKDRLEERTYAVKKVRLHLPITDDLRSELRNHKVYREVLALSDRNLELSHTVRYYNGWFEELTPEEVEEEKYQLERYNNGRKLSNITESQDSHDTNTVERMNDNSYESYGSEEMKSESEFET
jgi:hypothetical protein